LFGLRGMQRVAVGVQGNDFQTVFLEATFEGLAVIGAGEHLRQVKVRRGRPSAGVDLQARHSQPFSLLEHLPQGQVTEAVGDESQPAQPHTAGEPRSPYLVQTPAGFRESSFAGK